MPLRTLMAAALGFALAIAAPAVAMGANTGTVVSVKVNMARILRINAPAATVIIGNPGIADVTIQDPQTLVLTGKSYGETNLIVLDASGNPIADTMLQVVQDQANVVTVYQADRRTSLSCEPVCQPVIMIGDDASFTANVIASSRNIAGAAN
ncbi:pilus assembly protein N-terminal domain-containing protein [Devosia sp.]|uniref:pilus assembly protein N-terminal domain-containing protein n=1 Tax=Devosia sp. TaxID=1871048 RepID=UPI003A8FFE55